jgi:hypothetical protein
MSDIENITGGTTVSGAFEENSTLALDKIETYWNSIRKGRLVPQRFEIDPHGLTGVLAHAFILERVSGGLARFRIAGSQLTELAGVELRGMPLSSLFTGDANDELSDAVSATFDDPALVRLKVCSPTGFGKPALNGHIVLLPLRSDLGDITRVLGGFEGQGELGHTPRKLSIENQSRQGLVGYSGETPLHYDVGPSKPTWIPKLISTPSPEADLANVTASNSDGPHLRLVVSQ